MEYPILIIDKNVETFQEEQSAWAKHNMSGVRVDSMQDAINRLTADSFLFIAINGDNVSYMPLLSKMRAATQTLIFIIDSGHTIEQETKAYRNGADAYATFSGDAEKNVQLALALLLRHNERGKPPRAPQGMMIYENFLVMTSTSRIFYKDERLKLTKKEREILCYLIANHDILVPYEKIYRKVWGNDYDKYGNQSLWDYILKIRKKLKKVTGEKEYIINERDTGYRFSADIDNI